MQIDDSIVSTVEKMPRLSLIQLMGKRPAWQGAAIGSLTRSAGVLFMLILCAGRLELYAGEGHWVATWGCGPQLIESGNRPPVALANSTLRQFIHASIGGSRLRVRLSNAYGTNPVTIDSIHAALAAAKGSAGSGDINTATERALTFHGGCSITIPPGGVVLSDPFDCNLPPLANLAISIYFGSVSLSTASGHPGSRTTSFIQAGNVTTAASLPAAVTTPHWYFITGVEVLADSSSRTVVTFGDSITDGRGSTTDGNNRWPDFLAQLLNANAPTAGVAVANMGIGGNGIFGGLGPAGLRRFDRDVIGQSGVGWVIVFEGVNDIGGDGTGTIATNLIAAYAQFAAKAHSHHIAAYVATITPFGGNRYFTPGHEASRQTVNAWIRTNNLFDGMIDFDSAVRDPVTLTNLLSVYDTGDGLHLNPKGYQAMAKAIDPALFAN